MSRGEYSKAAMSHAGVHDGFEIFWAERGYWGISDKRGVYVDSREGWYIGIPDCEGDDIFGPFETSQAAFCQVKEAIDTQEKDNVSSRISS